MEETYYITKRKYKMLVDLYEDMQHTVTSSTDRDLLDNLKKLENGGVLIIC